MREIAMDPQKIDPLLTAEIVGSYVRHHTVGASQLPDLIASVHRTLGELGQPMPSEEVLTPAVSVRKSVRPEFVICLDCGYRGRILRGHISRRHGLTRDEYLKRWGLRHDHPLTAPGRRWPSLLVLVVQPKHRQSRQRYQRYRPRQILLRNPGR